eukprot:jgi/Phyca11/510401/fgenesh2_kg.PHYCAscaffold_59_\
MTDLITTDEVLLNDIVGLLDSSAPLTPRVFAVELAACTSAFTTPVVSCDAGTNPIDGIKTNQRVYKREMEKTRQRRYRQKLKDIRDEQQQQVDELSLELHQLTQQKSRKTQLETSRWTRPLTNSYWALAADRQRQQRVLSEEEHKRLLAAVNQQSGYIKELRRLTGDVSCFVEIPTKQLMTHTLYTTYLQQLEGCCVRVDPRI